MTRSALPDPDVARTVAILGGPAVVGKRLLTRMEAHDYVSRGLPAEVLVRLVGGTPALAVKANLDNALGISERTLQRRASRKGAVTGQAATKTAHLSSDQSNRLWKFAEIMGRAVEIFGSKAAAEAWLLRPAIALDQRRPIELLSSPIGVAAVEDLLTRLDYGVYT